MEENIKKDVHREITEEEAHAINLYIDNIYSLKVPPPQKPTKQDVSFLKIVGIEATGYSLSALSGVVLSAIRTGGLFFLLETILLKKYNIDPTFSLIVSLVAAMMSLGTFELYLVSEGFTKGKEKTNVTSSKIGLIVSFLVIICAGLFSSFVLVDVPAQNQMIMDIIVAIITGVGSGIITYCGGVNIGFSMLYFENKKNKMFSDYQDLYNVWRESAVRSYTTSQFNFNRKGGSILVQNRSDLNKNIEPQVQESLESSKKVPIYEQIRTAIEQYVQMNKELPGVSEFATANGFSKGYVSTALNEFIFRNKSWLKAENIVDDEKVTKAMKSLEKAKPEVANDPASDDW